jgi:hypothetical protein
MFIFFTNIFYLIWKHEIFILFYVNIYSKFDKTSFYEGTEWSQVECGTRLQTQIMHGLILTQQRLNYSKTLKRRKKQIIYLQKYINGTYMKPGDLTLRNIFHCDTYKCAYR